MTDIHLPVTEMEPPRGGKLLLINRCYGVATIGVYSPDSGWTHWHALPKFRRKT